jgi:hypothetical protein
MSQHAGRPQSAQIYFGIRSASANNKALWKNLACNHQSIDSGPPTLLLFDLSIARMMDSYHSGLTFPRTSDFWPNPLCPLGKVYRDVTKRNSKNLHPLTSWYTKSGSQAISLNSMAGRGAHEELFV